jgi:hypothetical protein
VLLCVYLPSLEISLFILFSPYLVAIALLLPSPPYPRCDLACFLGLFCAREESSRLH